MKEDEYRLNALSSEEFARLVKESKAAENLDVQEPIVEVKRGSASGRNIPLEDFGFGGGEMGFSVPSARKRSAGKNIPPEVMGIGGGEINFGMPTPRSIQRQMENERAALEERIAIRAERYKNLIAGERAYYENVYKPGYQELSDEEKEARTDAWFEFEDRTNEELLQIFEDMKADEPLRNKYGLNEDIKISKKTRQYFGKLGYSDLLPKRIKSPKKSVENYELNEFFKTPVSARKIPLEDFGFGGGEMGFSVPSAKRSSVNPASIPRSPYRSPPREQIENIGEVYKSPNRVLIEDVEEVYTSPLRSPNAFEVNMASLYPSPSINEEADLRERIRERMEEYNKVITNQEKAIDDYIENVNSLTPQEKEGAIRVYNNYLNDIDVKLRALAREARKDKKLREKYGIPDDQDSVLSGMDINNMIKQFDVNNIPMTTRSARAYSSAGRLQIPDRFASPTELGIRDILFEERVKPYRERVIYLLNYFEDQDEIIRGVSDFSSVNEAFEYIESQSIPKKIEYYKELAEPLQQQKDKLEGLVNPITGLGDAVEGGIATLGNMISSFGQAVTNAVDYLLAPGEEDFNF